MIEPELGAVTTEILATIAREVPEYARPFEGSFGRGVQVGVTEALRQFVALIRDPDSGREPGRDVYVGLGRGELRQGRTLDALQSAYRVGARVAWRRLAEAARRAGLDSGVISTLAESIFAYIEELSADSVEGYSQELSEREGERQRRRRELIALLLRDPPPAQAELDAAAEAAGWKTPRTAAALACREADLGRLARRLPPDALAGGDARGRLRRDRRSGGPRARAPGRGGGRPHDRRARPGGRARASWRARGRSPARRCGRSRPGRSPRPGAVRADERLPELLLHENPALVERLAARRLAPFEPLTPKARRRMEETALAYVQRQGNAAAMAGALDIHPQTARYRIARLRELLGTDLDDPDARFELELALRARGAGG